MFGNEQPTAFDVKFRLAGIPVRVTPWFWIIMFLLGSNLFNDPDFGPLYLLLWVACGFVSILVHEMGHAVLARFYGSPVNITLVAFGGVAQYAYPPRSAWKRIAISLSGPGAGFGLLGFIVASKFAFNWTELSRPAAATYWFLIIFNLFLNLLNLLPIWPLDGGKVARELFLLARFRNPDAAVHMLSMVVAGSIVAIGVLSLLGIPIPVEGVFLKMVVAYISHSLFLTIWMAMFAITNYQMLHLARNRGYYYEEDDTPPWRRN